jgi:glyoxylase-like metal-dependent hydrolase (beta-lactamase superfamily II)
MEPAMTIAVGDIAIRTVVESYGTGGLPQDVFPGATPEAVAPVRRWLEPEAMEPGTGRLLMPVQSYLVRTKHLNILLDTCVGNHKSHPGTEYHQHTEYTLLDDIAAAGVAPEEIDVVMCSHLHVDHAGWNTKLVDGRWVPSFPNARYIFSKKEVAFSEELGRTGESIYRESVLPVLEAGLAEIVEADFELDAGCWFEPTHGHTPGHVAIHLSSNGRRAVMSGDLIHSPLQLPRPEWSPIWDSDSAEGARTRRRFLESVAETDILMMTQHFPAPSVGHVFRRGEGFGMRYLGCDMVHG